MALERQTADFKTLRDEALDTFERIVMINATRPNKNQAAEEIQKALGALAAKTNGHIEAISFDVATKNGTFPTNYEPDVNQFTTVAIQPGQSAPTLCTVSQDNLWTDYGGEIALRIATQLTEKTTVGFQSRLPL